MNFTPTNEPFENEYPKLIRDNIPAIIKARSGEDLEVRVIKLDEEYWEYLVKKAVEEAMELQHADVDDNIKEEIADVLEVIGSIIKLKGWSVEQIVEIQKNKREKNGGFEKRIIMIKK